MKPCLWLIIILLQATPFALAQEKGAGRDPRPDESARELETAFRQLALEEQRSKLVFENEMRKLQVEEKRMALERGAQPGRTDGRFRHCPLGPGPKGRACMFLFPLVFFAVAAVIHLLLAFWVQADIHRRQAGSRLWIAIVLLTGLLGALVYAIVRLGDKPQA